MNKEELVKIIKDGATIESSSETRFSQVIMPRLLEAMGYNPMDENEVGIEVPVVVGRETKKADYKITSNGSNYVIDVKAPTVNIETDVSTHDQIHSYYRVLHSKYGVLYNGKKLIVFIEDSNEPKYIWRYDDDPSDIAIFEALSKENFPGGLEEILAASNNISKLKKFLLSSSMADMKGEIIQKISNSTSLDVSFVEQHTKVDIDYISTIDEEDTLGLPNLPIYNNEANNNELVLIRAFRDYGDNTGTDFVKRHRAWGFVRVGVNPDYLALYDVGNQAITKLYKVAKIEEVSTRMASEFPGVDLGQLQKERKKIIRFSEEIPIKPLRKGNKPMFRGGKFTTLSKLKSARTMDEL